MLYPYQQNALAALIRQTFPQYRQMTAKPTQDGGVHVILSFSGDWSGYRWDRTIYSVAEWDELEREIRGVLGVASAPNRAMKPFGGGR